MKIDRILEHWTSKYVTTENCIIAGATLGGVLIYLLARYLEDFF